MFISRGQVSKSGLGCLFVEVSRSHTIRYTHTHTHTHTHTRSDSSEKLINSLNLI